MSDQELIALVELLNRCPMTAAERQWAQALISRLAESHDPPPLPPPPTAEE